MADEAQDKTADSADLEALAERYLDLWQDQISAMAADPDFAKALQSLFGPAAWGAASGGSPLAAWQALMARQWGTPDAPAGEPGGRSNGAGDAPGAAPGAAPAAPAPDGGGADLDQLEQRLAALEARIAALEGGKSRRNSGGGAQGGARRKRS